MAALLLATLLFSSCGMTLQRSENGYVDKEGVTWQHASTCYQAVSLGEKLGKLAVADKTTYEIYEIPDMDASLWMATEEGNVLYADGVTLPTLADMAPASMEVCVENTTTYVIHTMTDTEALASVISAYTEHEPVLYLGLPVYKTYRIRFLSPDYPGLYYSLTYVEYAEDYVIEDRNYGKYFLYDRFDQNFVPIGDEIHNALGLGEEETA